MDTILNASHVVRASGCKTLHQWISQLCRRKGRMLDLHYTGQVSGAPVQAEVEAGRWIARCECGGAEYVDPGEAIFYCFHCANFATHGDARPVRFPEEREEIEALLAKRPIILGPGQNMVQRVFNARPVILARMWRPGTPIETLREQNANIGV